MTKMGIVYFNCVALLRCLGSNSAFARETGLLVASKVQDCHINPMHHDKLSTIGSHQTA